MAKILVVDDNAANRSLLVTLLGYSGHTMREAGDGEEALAMIAAEHPNLLVSDILMPAMDGYQLVRRLRSDPKTANTPVILCSAHFQEYETKSLAKKCGVEYVLAKPLELEALQAAVDDCLRYAAPPPVAELDDDFNREHLQLLLNKLKKQTDKLTAANLRLEELIDATLVPLASAGEPRRLLEELCESARHLINARFALVGLTSPLGEVAEAFAVAGMDWESYSRFNQRPETQLAVAALVLNRESGGLRRVRLRNPGGNPAALGFPADYPAFHSVLAAPIVSPTRTYGWLGLFHKIDAAEFSVEEERLAGALAALAGRIYEDASIHASDRERAEELEKELTARKQAETETSQAVERLNLALNASRTGIWAWDAVRNRMAWDENIHAMCGVAPGTFQGTLDDSAAVVHEEDRAATVSAFQSCTPQHSECAMSFRVVWPDGSLHYLDAHGRAYYNQAAQLIRMIGTTRDVTDRHELEEQLRQAQKMEAVGRLAGGVAHDFNNMLNVILGYSDLLLAKPLLEDSVHRRTVEIRKAAVHAAALTQQLLAFSRQQVLQPRVVNLADILAALQGMLGRMLGAHIEIATMLDEHLAPVRIDPTQVQQVIINLAVNARDAMPQGGKLNFEFKNVTLDESQVRTDGIPPGIYVMLAVSDNGSGMTAEVQKRVFEPFFTTKGVGEGTGLGLATVYGIVRQSGGYIRLDSKPGAGTTFQIFFPRVERHEETPPPLPEEPLQQHAVSAVGTILVVEDDPGVRALVEEVLQSAGYNVLMAQDGTQALRISAEYAGPIQLLLSDVIMPKMGGKEVATRLTEPRPDMPVLFMSGYPKNEMAQNGSLNGEVHFLQKPWTPRGLCEKIESLLSARPAQLRGG